MKRISLGILVCMLVVIFASCDDKSESDWKTYSDKVVSFIYPSDWQTGDNESIKPKPDLILVELNRESEKEFVTNLNLLRQESSGLAMSAEKQAEETISWYEMFGDSFGIEDYEKIEFIPREIANNKAGILISEFTISQNGYRVRNMQLIVPNKQITHLLTLTCSKERWEEFRPVFDEIVSSFKLLE